MQYLTNIGCFVECFVVRSFERFYDTRQIQQLKLEQKLPPAVAEIRHAEVLASAVKKILASVYSTHCLYAKMTKFSAALLPWQQRFVRHT